MPHQRDERKVRRPHHFDAGKLDAAIGHYRDLLKELVEEGNERIATLMLGSLVKAHLTHEGRRKMGLPLERDTSFHRAVEASRDR